MVCVHIYISAQLWNHVYSASSTYLVASDRSDTHRLILTMHFLKASQLSLAKYGKAVRSAPREVAFNRHLLVSAIVYAMAAVPASKS